MLQSSVNSPLVHKKSDGSYLNKHKYIQNTGIVCDIS